MRYKFDMPKWRRKYLFLKANIVGQLGKIKAIILTNPIAILIKLIDNRKQFPNQLSVVAILKNESSYVQEWIEFHKLVGVTKFYLFDNESEDDLDAILKPYILDGTVELHKIAGHVRQLDAYKQAIEIAKEETNWLAILDLDEFLLPLGKNSVLGILNETKKSALLVGWMIFGSSGFIKRPEGLVLENYRKHASNEFIADYKIIVNPRKVIRVVHPHFVQVLGRTTDENGKRLWNYPYCNVPQALPASKKRIRVNHYYSKSFEEFLMKSKRGFADQLVNEDQGKNQNFSRSIADFKEHDQNVEEDDSLNYYLPQLKAKLKNKK